MLLPPVGERHPVDPHDPAAHHGRRVGQAGTAARKEVGERLLLLRLDVHQEKVGQFHALRPADLGLQASLGLGDEGDQQQRGGERSEQGGRGQPVAVEVAQDDAQGQAHPNGEQAAAGEQQPGEEKERAKQHHQPAGEHGAREQGAAQPAGQQEEQAERGQQAEERQ